VLDRPLVLLPHSRRGFYCHSGLPDDLGIDLFLYRSMDIDLSINLTILLCIYVLCIYELGIQYQTVNKNQVVAEDKVLAVYPGLGHTGSDPFDQVNGWYKSYRGILTLLFIYLSMYLFIYIFIYIFI
jgi:hypothetical protein